MKWYDKFFCGHKWKVHEEVDGCRGTEPFKSDFKRQTLICELCGKIKRIELRSS